MKLLFVIILAVLLSMSAIADELPLGQFSGSDFFYDTESIISHETLVSVVVLTHDKNMNINNIPDFNFMAARVILDCSDSTEGLMSLFIVNNKNEIVIDDSRIKPDGTIDFHSISPHTVEAAVFIALCKKPTYL